MNSILNTKMSSILNSFEDFIIQFWTNPPHSLFNICSSHGRQASELFSDRGGGLQKTENTF